MFREIVSLQQIVHPPEYVTRVRDKNQLKRLANRPPHLKPSSISRKAHDTSAQSLLNNETHHSDVFPDVTSEAASQLFTLEPEMASHIQQLTDNLADVPATSPETEDVQGANFSLEPEMAKQPLPLNPRPQNLSMTQTKLVK